MENWPLSLDLAVVENGKVELGERPRINSAGQRGDHAKDFSMTSHELNRLFMQVAEDARFRLWNEKRSQAVRYFYACEHGEVWKFTPKAWWQLVTKTILNGGRHDFFLSKALGHRPTHIVKGEDKEFYSSDRSLRCINPLDWTVENWTDELARA